MLTRSSGVLDDGYEKSNSYTGFSLAFAGSGQPDYRPVPVRAYRIRGGKNTTQLHGRLPISVRRRLSVQAEGGLIAAPFDRYTLRTLEAFGLDPTLSRALDRSFRRGSSVSLGVNVHAGSAWYAGAYGQYVRLAAGPITPADALGVYFKRDFSGFGLLNSPTFVFNMQSNLWVAGLRVSRSIRFADSRLGLNVEASLGKIVATRNTFSSNRSLVDGLGLTQRLYDNLNAEVDTKLRQNGFLPTLNLLLTYRMAGQR